MNDLFRRFDLLVTAGPYGPASLISEVAANWSFDGPEITVPFSLTSVPAYRSVSGSRKTTAALHADDRTASGRWALLRAAQSYQGATSWHNHHPPISRMHVAAVSRIRREETLRGIQRTRPILVIVSRPRSRPLPRHADDRVPIVVLETWDITRAMPRQIVPPPPRPTPTRLFQLELARIRDEGRVLRLKAMFDRRESSRAHQSTRRSAPCTAKSRKPAVTRTGNSSLMP